MISFPAAQLPQQYKPMLFSRWLRSLRYGNPLYKKISSKKYFEDYHKYIENLLAKPDSIVHLAVLSEDHDIVLGFAVIREDVMDYIHVHTDYRRVGIAKALMLFRVTTFTHLTATGLIIWQAKEKYKYLKFNPRA